MSTRKNLVKTVLTKTGIKRIQKPDYVEAINECSFSASTFLERLINDENKDNSFQAIKNKIDRLSHKYDGDIVTTGIHIFMNCIRRRLTKLKKKYKHEEDREIIEERLEYFRSDECSVNFAKKLVSSNYSKFLNQLFDVTLQTDNTSKRWREKLVKLKNTRQCEIALAQSVDVKTCYLCGYELEDDDKKDCEHILPLISALSHLWLVKGEYDSLSKTSKRLIKKEYAWAHDCCNKKKGSKDIIIQKKNGDYYVSEEIIENLLNNINDDCFDIDDIEDQVEEIRERHESIVNIINKNVREYGSDYYSLFMKYKVIAAISDDFFEKIIMGDDYLGGSPEGHVSSIEKINPLDGLVNIIKSEYLTNVILNDIDEYVKETVELYGIKEKIIVEHKPLKISQSFMHKKIVRPSRQSMLHYGITRQAGGTNKNKTRKLV